MIDTLGSLDIIGVEIYITSNKNLVCSQKRLIMEAVGQMFIKNSTAESLSKLSDWASSLLYEDIPNHVLQHAILILGDNIAATLSASNEPEVNTYHSQLLNQAGSRESTIFRKDGPKTSFMNAALANGLAITWNELDDGYTRTAIHPGALSQPLILAVAQANNLSIQETLRAVVVAYEIGTRFARSWPETLPRLHPHGVFNAVCSAAGYASLMKFDKTLFMNALTGACTMVSPGPYSHPIEGALIRNAWPAAGAWLGYFACQMAQVNIFGTPSGPYDVYQVGLGANSKPEHLCMDLGSDWTITAGYHKLYGSCHHAHASMEAIEKILNAHPKLRGGDAIHAIHIEVSKMAMNFNNANPTTTLAAKFSIPHAAAATIVNGAKAIENFLHESMSNTTIASIRNKVLMREMKDIPPWPYDRPAKVTIELKNGDKISEFCEAALGSSARPLERNSVLEKINLLTQELAPNVKNSVVYLGEQLEKNPNLSLKTNEWILSFFVE
jgi:2-methylcitrate dehydratase PrpD